MVLLHYYFFMECYYFFMCSSMHGHFRFQNLTDNFNESHFIKLMKIKVSILKIQFYSYRHSRTVFLIPIYLKNAPRINGITLLENIKCIDLTNSDIFYTRNSFFSNLDFRPFLYFPVLLYVQ